MDIEFQNCNHVEVHTEDLRAFFMVVESGSLTAAARRLAIPKSTLGRRLTRLEETLDRQLVIRTPRHTEITDAGRRLYERGEPLLTSLDELGSALMDRPSEPSGELRVAAPPDVAAALLGRLCGEFTRRYPKVQVSLTASSAVVDLLSDGFDVALRVHFDDLPDNAALRVRRLGTVDVALFATPGYLEERGTPRTPKNLQRHALLTMARLPRSWSLVHARSDRAVRLRINPKISCNDHQALLGAALADAGIATLPEFLCAEAVTEGRLKRVLPAWALRTAHVSLLWPDARHVVPRLRAFLDFAIEAFADRPLG